MLSTLNAQLASTRSLGLQSAPAGGAGGGRRVLAATGGGPEPTAATASRREDAPPTHNTSPQTSATTRSASTSSHAHERNVELLLALETSTDPASVAVLRNGAVVAEIEFAAQRRLSQTLILRIDEALAQAGASLRDIAGVAVSLGPGSFTGLRIGVGTAKALAQVNGWKIVGVPTHHAIAEREAGDVAGVVCVATVARADEVYASILRRADGGWQEIRACAVYRVAELKDVLLEVGEKVTFCGDASVTWADGLKELGALAPEAGLGPRAREVGVLAEQRLRSGVSDELNRVRPLYARPSQAEAAHGMDLGLSR